MASASALPRDVQFSPSQTPDAYVDPFPLYRRMRETDPVHYNESENVFYLTRYADVQRVIRNPELASSAMRKGPDVATPDYGRVVGASGTGGLTAGQDEGFGTTWSMLLMDPPQHTRLRKLVSKAFTTRVVQRMEDAVALRTNELLDEMVGRAEVDFIADFARHLPTRTMADLLGIRRQRWDVLVELSDVSEEVMSPDCSDETIARHAELSLMFNEVIQEVIDDKRAAPGDDIVSDMIALEEQGDKLSEVELRSMVWTIISAGTKTTVDLLGNGFRLLGERPDVMRRLREDPDMTRVTVEEVLRFEPPAHVVNRVAKVDFEVGGKEIRRGQSLINLVAAANRDPEQFAQPEEFVPDRLPNRHLSFGSGAHFCLGGPLAKMEFVTATNTILARFPELHLTATPQRRRSVRHGGVDRLLMALG